MPRITSIASSSASTLWPGVSLRPPLAGDRVPEGAGPEAELHPAAAEPVESQPTLLASTAGGRSGRLATFGGEPHVARSRAATNESSVHVSR